jgi:hypothetical protein
MSESESRMQDGVIKNRAEEFGLDVWQDFVIPPFYDLLGLDEARKPWVLRGGRGCGKTMLLRYLSHHSVFSRTRNNIPKDAAHRIGLYWRADTQFATTMQGRGLEQETWRSAFFHLLALTIGSDLLLALKNIADSHCPILSGLDLDRLNLSELRHFDPECATTFDELRKWLKGRNRSFQTWVNNPRSLTAPPFLPGMPFVLGLIEELTEQIEPLKNSTFFVYIDEYENLTELQQRIINTYIKHSETPLILNIATKHYGMETIQTLSQESITSIADYREHNLDAYLIEAGFEVFATEILILRLREHASRLPAFPFDVDRLREHNSLAERRTLGYRSRTLTWARKLFPGQETTEVAKGVLVDKSMSKKLREDIDKALKQGHRGAKAKLTVEDFWRDEFGIARLIVPALLSRSGQKPDGILKELRLYAEGQANRFSGKTNWLHNNLFGCLLKFYATQTSTCPLYAGFDTFISLSKENARHFLELCYKSIKRTGLTDESEWEGERGSFSVPVPDQAEAARQASTAFLQEVRGFGRLGYQLHSFVLTLGELFKYAHLRPTQSEPEISHFAIRSGDRLDVQDEVFFKESLKWSVLRSEQETKVKNDISTTGEEWVLNPIYSPYFNISYRKRRKLELTADEVTILIRGSYDERRSLLSRYYKKWTVSPPDVPTPLFPTDEGQSDAS